MTDPRRALPSVHSLLASDGIKPLLDRAPRPMVVAAIQVVLRNARTAGDAPRDAVSWPEAVEARLEDAERVSLRRVINATGVVLHTNLGRAPLAQTAIDAIARVASGYSNLEYDLGEGTRGSRYMHCASLLRELTGAEDALVVNNGAAALVLALNSVSNGRDALLSRGELVEIGGSFRIHDIMAKSGAALVEVGATNRTHLADYERAASDKTGAILKVHRSNFVVEGYVAEVNVPQLSVLAQRLHVPVIHDLGSGLLISLATYGLEGEPTAREAIDAGAGIVVMSGDKLLGGPQAGIILGQARYLNAMRENSLARSYRVDKLTLSALEATLALYREPARALKEIPALMFLSASHDDILRRAKQIFSTVTAQGIACEIVESTGSVGGGAYPRTALPSVAIALSGDAERWATALRNGEPHVIGRIKDDRFLIDFRAIPVSDLETLTTAILHARA